MVAAHSQFFVWNLFYFILWSTAVHYIKPCGTIIHACLILQAADSATGGGASSRNEILSRISKMGQPMLPVSSPVTSGVPLPTATVQDPVMVYSSIIIGIFVLWVLVFLLD